MWWEPRSQEERQLAEVLPQIEGQFLENRRQGNIFGVGTFLPRQFYDWWVTAGLRDYWQRMPLARSLWQRLALVAFPWRIPLPYRLYWERYRHDYWHYPVPEWYLNRLFGREPLPLILLNPAMADQPVVPMEPYLFFELPNAAQAEVEKWRLPSETVFLFVSAPEVVDAVAPVATQTDRAIRCAKSGKLGTAGVRLKADNAPGGAASAFLTAGHMFPDGVDSLVELVKYPWPRWLRSPRYQKLGRVVCHSTPQGANSPTYDAAVVEEAVVGSHLPNLAHTGVAKTPPRYEQPALGTIYGGVSGVVRNAGIVGALSVYGSPDMLWKNSWLLVPSGAIVHGDSGGAFILDPENKVAGMVVGGSWVEMSDRFMVQYVQDMASIQRDFLSPAGFSIA